MKNLATTKVSKIVAQNFKTAAVFSTYDIDFCCNGGIPLSEACAMKGADLTHVVRELEEVLQEADTVDYTALSMSQLIEHIVGVHHKYVTNTTPLLQAYLAKLCLVHGERHPELHEVKALFDETAGAMAMHMKKEELILFPYIQAMNNAMELGTSLSEPHFGHINNPIAMMEMEHATEGDRLREIARLSDRYTCPPDGCQTYRVAYSMLKEFEQDLHKHVHLENNILFPQARQAFLSLAG